MNRRAFVARSAAAVAGMTISNRTRAATSPNDQITIAAIGVRGRGFAVLKAFAARPDVDVKYVCDVDRNVLEKRTGQISEILGRTPNKIADFRTALDDPSVDAIILGTPTHWHAIPMIMACQAGKDVYVEKPDAHNCMEGKIMVAALKKYQRVVQLGIQSRSGLYFQEMIDYVREGHLGKTLFAKAWESIQQRSLGHPPNCDPPAGVDYDTWLGPAPLRPFNPLRFHGNWRWFFDYGAGDLGNDGVHRLDFTHWAFETAVEAYGDPPLGPLQAVSAHGGKSYFDDMQQWPDNLQVTYDYGAGRVMTYEMRLWTPYPFGGEHEGGAVYGDQGYLLIGNHNWRAYSPEGELLKQGAGSYSKNTHPHVANFLECMRSRNKPQADLETVGHPASLMCHLGNAAWRAGRTIRLDRPTYTCIGDREATGYLERANYRKPWTLPTLARL
ncbi:MAG: Gfo/Idh/MocA family oxidoreductase [Pirellulales bacterium]|nr:Gfo/Idh/MocA family oxidoreductase [Pirellulales bacterium]